MEEPVINVREFIASYNGLGSNENTFSIEHATEFFKKKLYESIPSYTNLDAFLGIEVELKSTDAYSDGYCDCSVNFYGLRPETVNEKEKRVTWENKQATRNRKRQTNLRKKKERDRIQKDKRDREKYEKLKERFERLD